MKPKNTIWILVLLAICVAHGAWAQTKTCDSLRGTKREIALSILRSQHPYDCCDATILQCFSKEPVCPLVVRLANDVCRRVEADQSKVSVEQALSRRAASATGPRVDIDISEATVAGDPKAKVEIVEYTCVRCAYCSVSTLNLYKSVTSGRLKGKAKLFVRSFVIRSHKGATAGAMAMMAAQRLGKFWEMLLHMYKNFDHFDPAKLPEWAASQGMDADRFRELMEDAGLLQKLVESQKEGIRNHVEKTPTIFVNRRKYSAGLSLETIEDFVEGEYERLAKQSGTSTEVTRRSTTSETKQHERSKRPVPIE